MGEPVVAAQVLIRDDAADGIARREKARGPQLIDDVPEVEVLKCAAGEVLALGYVVEAAVALDDGTGNAAPAELDCQGQANRSASDDRYLVGGDAQAPPRAAVTTFITSSI